MQDDLSPLQQSVLDKYAKLAEVLHNLDDTLKEVNSSEYQVSPDDVTKQMREVESKVGLVGTLLKGSVYSFILQQKQDQEKN